MGSDPRPGTARSAHPGADPVRRMVRGPALAGVRPAAGLVPRLRRVRPRRRLLLEHRTPQRTGCTHRRADRAAGAAGPHRRRHAGADPGRVAQPLPQRPDGGRGGAPRGCGSRPGARQAGPCRFHPGHRRPLAQPCDRVEPGELPVGVGKTGHAAVEMRLRPGASGSPTRRPHRHAQRMCWPPFIDRLLPVRYPASSLATKATSAASSSGRPSRPTGISATIRSTISAGMPVTSCVAR